MVGATKRWDDPRELSVSIYRKLTPWQRYMWERDLVSYERAENEMNHIKLKAKMDACTIGPIDIAGQSCIPVMTSMGKMWVPHPMPPPLLSAPAQNPEQERKFDKLIELLEKDQRDRDFDRMMAPLMADLNEMRMRLLLFEQERRRTVSRASDLYGLNDLNYITLMRIERRLNDDYRIALLTASTNAVNGTQA